MTVSWKTSPHTAGAGGRGWARLAIAAVACAACALALGSAGFDAAAAASAVVDVAVNLPSASTGAEANTLALRVFVPAPGRSRYASGAPVVIWIPGGMGPGSLEEPIRAAQDVIRIVFLFPGGRDGETGRRSAGTYDQRGASSLAALRDVVRYAAGGLSDAQGRRIGDLTPVPVLTRNVGLLGSSNGGNAAVAMASEHGATLAGRLRYVVQWESPVSSQVVTGDLGGIRLECAGGRQASLRLVNPSYRGYGLTELLVDYESIAYDPANTLAPVFLDGNRDGRYTTVPDPATGCRTPDLDADGVLEANEDFPLGSDLIGTKRVHSRPATRALAYRSVFGDAWPATIASVEEASSHWELREAVRHYAGAVARLPGLEAMALASVEDHAQAAQDHPHVRQAFDGWRSAGAWVQLNPSLDYLADADPGLAARAALPLPRPNTPPASWADPSSYALPEDVSVDATQVAAVWQMADRAQGERGTPPR